ncbi:MAG: Txe/YoeB family addiction module toxin [Bacteroidaceae bacterium]|nr:Txe/YoeB family addiction module toxin [Bacteroidaceae bacterium]
MTYNIDFKEQAARDLIALEKNEPKAFLKAQALIAELREHPRTGTGKPEQLTGERAGQWSRRITKKHRLVYEIHDTEVVVLVLTAYGHYDDK